MFAAVIEDQALVRDYLAGLLGREFGVSNVVKIGSMAELKSREAELVGMNLTLLDIDLGDGTTIDWAVKRSAAAAAGTLVALSSITGAFPFQRLQMAGIRLVHKNDGEAELLNVIRQALAGAVMLSRGAVAVIQQAGRDPNSPTKLLTARELQVLAFLGQRLGSAEIAELLGCAVATAVDHRKRIMNKLDLHSIEEVIDYAIRHGIIHDSAAAASQARRWG